VRAGIKKKKGGDSMAVPVKKLEVERVMNLVTGFGWDMVEERHSNGDIIITIKKTLTAEQLEMALGPSPGAAAGPG